MHKCFVELRETAESGDHSLWVRRQEQPLLHTRSHVSHLRRAKQKYLYLPVNEVVL